MEVCQYLLVCRFSLFRANALALFASFSSFIVPLLLSVRFAHAHMLPHAELHRNSLLFRPETVCHDVNLLGLLVCVSDWMKAASLA